MARVRDRKGRTMKLVNRATATGKSGSFVVLDVEVKLWMRDGVEIPRIIDCHSMIPRAEMSTFSS